jgi:hypothetical protein
MPNELTDEEYHFKKNQTWRELMAIIDNLQLDSLLLLLDYARDLRFTERRKSAN